MATTKQFGIAYPAATLPLAGTETTSIVQGGLTKDVAVSELGAASVAITELTGDVTATGPGSVAATIANDAVTNAKAANMATATIKGRTTAGTGDPEDLTIAQAATLLQGDGLDTESAGFRGVPQNSQSGNYTCVAADAGKHIFHPSGAGAGDIFTIPANASVAYEIGTALTFVNMDSNALSIAITSDTMNLAGTGTAGTRTLAQYGIATALKLTSTSWLISGTGLT